MTDRPTPETDVKAVPHIGFYSCATVPADFARRLERDRDEAREELDELNKRLIEVSQLGADLLIEREDLRNEIAAERTLADRLANSLMACERWVNQPCDVKTEANKALIEWKEARK